MNKKKADWILEVKQVTQTVFQEEPEYVVRLMKGDFPNSQLLPAKRFCTYEEAELAKGILLCLLKQDVQNAMSAWTIHCKMVFRLLDTPNRW